MTLRRLKHAASVLISNVDKKAVAGERPIRLCNYTDVYYHDRITTGLPFMEATATNEQIERFGVRANDVLLTKDSETPDDIAVPAYVAEDLIDVVCGYHLALLRPNPGTDGRYLFWALASQGSRTQFSTSANGITRFGLRYDSLGDVRIPLPSLERQRAIADYLDAETARIDALIEKKRLMINLLEERWRVAVRGEMHALGESTGWAPLKRFVECLDGRRVPLSGEERASRQGAFPYYGASGVIDQVDDYLLDETLVLLGEDGAQLADPDCEISFVVKGKVWVNNHAHVLRPVAGEPYFLALHLSTLDRGSVISGSTREKITQEDMSAIPVPALDLAQQESVSAHMQATRSTSRNAALRIEQQIALLSERRQALITAAVTGELDVPGVAA